MRVRKKRLGLITLIASAFIALCGAIGVSLSSNTLTASAATSNRYIYFAYTFTDTSPAGFGNHRHNNSIATNSFAIDGNRTTEVLIRMNADTNGTGYFEQGGYVKGSSVSFTAMGSESVEQFFIIRNASNTVVASSSNAYCSGNFSDGTYTVEYQSIKRNYDGMNPSYELRITTSFKVDTKAPSISGASTSTTGKYTKSSFTVSASDSGSGVANLYWKSPTASSYSTVASSKTVSSSSANGLYSFYAKDNLGFQSGTYYVYLDTVAPTGTISTADGAISSGSKTRKQFKYNATDSGSGISKLEYMPPNSSTWYSYTANTYFSAGATNGTYYFRAIDKVGNVASQSSVTYDSTAPKLTSSIGSFLTTSEKGFTVTATDDSGATLYYKAPNMSGYAVATGGSHTVSMYQPDGKFYYYAVDGLGNTTEGVWIELKVLPPVIEVVWSTATNRAYVTWTDNSYTVKLNGIAYDKNKWISTEGDYSATATNIYGRSTTKTFSIGHSYYVERVVPPTCVAVGYSVYQCMSCSHNYTDNYVAALGHSYETELIEPTCSTNGFVLHTCIRCPNEYQTDIVPAYGHKYVTEHKEPTCTEDGGVVNRCAVCDYTYMEDVIYATGHSYSSEVVRAVTCTTAGERRHTCDVCGDTYSTTITATGHNYQMESESKVDGVITRMYICTNCGHTYTEEVGEHYDMVSNFVVEIINEYKPYMIWVFLATAGIWSIVMGIMLIIAKKNEDKEKAKKMLANYLVGLVVIFVLLVACPYLIKGIAALVT